jgi:FkbM family methyltransferase
VQKKIQETLMRNIKINNIKNCQTFNFGLSSIKKKKIISMPNYLTEKNIGGFSIDSLTRNNNYEVSDSLNKETLLLDRLDSSNFKKVILIKLDVEGHELDVLKGSINTIIKNNYPLIIFEAFQRVEFKNKISKVFTFLKKFKYKIIRINSNCIAYAHDNYKMEFINAYIREVNLKNSFNPNQGIHYNSKQLYLTCKRKFFG